MSNDPIQTRRLWTPQKSILRRYWLATTLKFSNKMFDMWLYFLLFSYVFICVYVNVGYLWMSFHDASGSLGVFSWIVFMFYQGMHFSFHDFIFWHCKNIPVRSYYIYTQIYDYAVWNCLNLVCSVDQRLNVVVSVWVFGVFGTLFAQCL